MRPISLDEMKGVQLMNRVDTKYVVTETQLLLILQNIRTSYYAQEVSGNRFAPYKTVYYDTPDLTMYIIHHNRHLVRDKVRVRTYLDSDLSFAKSSTKATKAERARNAFRLSRLQISLTMQKPPLSLLKSSLTKSAR